MLNRFERFLFATTTEKWVKSFPLLIYPYLVYVGLGYDWKAYTQMSPYLYAPAGLASILGNWYPSLELLYILQALLVVSAILAMAGQAFRFSAFVVFFISLLFDVWHNGFGFINVQIHAIWFAGFMALTGGPKTRGKRDEALGSLAFRMAELTVVLAYVQAGIGKLMIGGLPWITEGSTLQIALMRQSMPLGMSLAQHSAIMPWLSAFSVGFELLFVLYYFVRPLRFPLLLTGILFHIGTYALLGIGFFHLWVFSLSAILYAPEAIGLSKWKASVKSWLGRTQISN